MAITAMGIGTKQAPTNVNLDPQSQFWSWLYAFKNAKQIGTTAYRNGLFAGFTVTQNDPSGMSVLIGADDPVNSAVLEYAAGKMALLSTDGTPQTVNIPTAPASGSRIDSIVSYIDTSQADPETETPGTPEYVKTVVVSGTAASSPTAPTKEQIQSALPPTVENWYHWCDVKVAQSQTVITNSNITDRKPTSPNVYYTAPAVWGSATSVTATGGQLGTATWSKRSCGNATVYSLNSSRQEYTVAANSWIKLDAAGAYKLPAGINVPTESTGANNVYFSVNGYADDGAVQVNAYVMGGQINLSLSNRWTAPVTTIIRVACTLWVFS